MPSVQPGSARSTRAESFLAGITHFLPGGGALAGQACCTQTIESGGPTDTARWHRCRTEPSRVRGQILQRFLATSNRKWGAFFDLEMSAIANGSLPIARITVAGFGIVAPVREFPKRLFRSSARGLEKQFLIRLVGIRQNRVENRLCGRLQSAL
jgi:hypothetical protein